MAFPLRRHAEITCWQNNQWKLVQVHKCHLCPPISPSPWFSSCALILKGAGHPGQFKNYLIIIDLSVLIFINNCACDDPAGMLMSPQLELISCRHCSGRLSIHSMVLCMTVRCILHCWVFSDGANGWWDVAKTTFLFSSTLGFHKRKCFPSKIFYFLLKVYVHSLHYSWLSVQSLHLISKAISFSDRPPRGSWTHRNSSANRS